VAGSMTFLVLIRSADIVNGKAELLVQSWAIHRSSCAHATHRAGDSFSGKLSTSSLLTRRRKR
jgi:hypothetical protein